MISTGPSLPATLPSLLCFLSFAPKRSVLLVNWQKVARLPRKMGRAPCCDKNGLKRGPWTPEEDQKLLDYIQAHGPGNWRTLPKNAGLQRCGKSCRLRWTNYLRPDIKRGKFSFEEEETIIHLHSMLGNKWSAIASRLPGRTDNEIKNYWNTHIRKRLLRMGIDPITHNPRLDLLDLSSIFNQSLYNQQYTTNPNSQFRLLGLQPMVNPEILKLATSIFSRPTQPDPNSTFTMPTTTNSQIQNQEQFFQTTNLPTTTLTPNPCCMPPLSSSCDQAQALAPIGESLSHLQAYDNLIDVGFDDHTQSLCETTNFAGHLPNLLDTDRMNQQNYLTCYNESTFGSNDRNMMGSMFSGLSSNSTPLHSNSNSNSTYITTEDERESYCSNLMKFQFPADLFDVSEYL